MTLRAPKWSRCLVVALTLGFTVLLACATSPNKALNRLQVGMDKDDVLGAVGNPKRTFRSDDQDHWLFVYFEEGKEMRRQLDFKSGRLIVIGPALPKESWTEDLENTRTMEEFEEKVRSHKRPLPTGATPAH